MKLILQVQLAERLLGRLVLKLSKSFPHEHIPYYIFWGTKLRRLNVLEENQHSRFPKHHFLHCLSGPIIAVLFQILQMKINLTL